jgi:HD-GYP domain-containing protein (c-di-GMP phosphodiesterase class II)
MAPAAAVRALPGFEAVSIVLRFTRERWDGGGPQGLRGDRIPLASRILAVCAAVGVPFDDTLRAIQGASGAAFDPAVVNALSCELLGPVPSLEETPSHWADGDRLFAL